MFSDEGTVLELMDVTKLYRRPTLRLGRQAAAARPALDNIRLTVRRGEIVGVLGRNGGGKSTLLRVAGGVSSPSSGNISRPHTIRLLLELTAGMHPSLTGRANALFLLELLGYAEDQLPALMRHVADFSELASAFDEPVREYSAGMLLRLGFAVSCAGVDPDLFVIDEVLAVGDLGFQVKCQRLLRGAVSRGTGLLFATQQPALVLGFADRAVLVEDGRIVLDGDPSDVVTAYGDLLAGTHAFETPVDSDPQGSGALEMLALKASPSSGSSLEPSQRVDLRLTVQALKDSPQCQAFIRVRDSLGTTQAWAYANTPVPQMAKGERLKITLSLRLPLAQGRYSCTVGFGSVLLIEPCAYFDVASRAGSRGSVDIDPQLSWTVLA